MQEVKKIPVKLEIKTFLITFEYVTWKIKKGGTSPP